MTTTVPAAAAATAFLGVLFFLVVFGFFAAVARGLETSTGVSLSRFIGSSGIDIGISVG